MTVVSTEDVLAGEPRLEGRRVSVLQVAVPVLEGHEPSYVADQLGLSLGEVHEALAYYYKNPDEMADLRDDYEDFESELAGLSEQKSGATS